MSKDQTPKQLNATSGALDKFEPGGESGPIEDRNQYEQRLNSLPADEKELALDSARFADLCHYFAQQKMDVPPHVLEQVGRLSTLSVVGRTSALKDINRELMEYLNAVGQDPGIRQ
jgi:hypothetical protein